MSAELVARRLAVFADRAGEAVGLLAAGPGRAALDEAVGSFADGLRAALAGRSEVRAARPAIAREGLGMGAALLDALAPARSSRLAALIDGPLPYFVALGAGMAAARLDHDALPAPLAELGAPGWDGFGFQRAILEPHRLRGAVRLGHDDPCVRAGAGRALWFLTAGDADAILARAARIDPDARRDVLRGAGVASAFSGGAVPAVIEAIRAADPHGDFDAGRAHGARARLDVGE